ncbi:hypothetical protein I306_05193 [Cryptococcus gattii EJB2]|uniref:MULE transposase domain-containing protein n=1 Tax=Cryptococcus gattii EJB2 TaxID=1296103 RepID=A0ABR5BQN2_9TREE|nr:hypothetical protein I306_05193 [Cryptococcus gattii EJB2]
MTTPPPRSVQTIKASLEQQLDLAMQGGSVDATKKLQAEKKAKDEIYKIMQDWFDQQPGLKMNPLLDVAGYQRTMNIHMATLESAVKDCLDADKSDASYIWQYSHALNGRHYRFLWQCLPLQLLGIFPKAEDKVTCQVMLAIAALGAHLCRAPVSMVLDSPCNMNLDPEILTANVQDLLDEICPDIITKKPKVHYFCHIIRDVLRFGPVVHQATERYKKFNNVFRGCTIHGNGQVNSRNVDA